MVNGTDNPTPVTEVTVVQEPEERKKSQTGRRILTIVLIILILLLCGSGYFLFKLMVPKGGPLGEQVGQVGWVRSIYGYGPNADQMTTPSTITLDPANGNIWVADPGKYRLVEYAPDGSLVELMDKNPATTPEGYFRVPSKIALDREGLLYVAEPTYGEIRVFDTAGEEQGMFAIPSPLGIDANDDYIVVGSSGGFAVTDKFGNALQIVGEPGRGPDQFDRVNGVAIDDDNTIYVVDTFNNRLSSWTIEGERNWIVDLGYPQNQTMTGETEFETDAAAKLQVPMGITIDNNGHLVIADMFDFSLAVFNKEDGSFVAKYGEVGMDDGQLYYPSDIEYDPIHDWFVVADNGAKRVQILTLPDSGGSLAAKARQGLSGPLRACCFPLILIILVLVGSYIIGRLNRKRRERALQETLVVAAASQEPVVVLGVPSGDAGTAATSIDGSTDGGPQ